MTFPESAADTIGGSGIAAPDASVTRLSRAMASGQLSSAELVRFYTERIERRNLERPEGSHHLAPEQFAYISSFFEPPTQEEAFEVRRYGG